MSLAIIALTDVLGQQITVKKIVVSGHMHYTLTIKDTTTKDTATKEPGIKIFKDALVRGTDRPTTITRLNPPTATIY